MNICYLDISRTGLDGWSQTSFRPIMLYWRLLCCEMWLCSLTKVHWHFMTSWWKQNFLCNIIELLRDYKEPHISWNHDHLKSHNFLCFVFWLSVMSDFLPSLWELYSILIESLFYFSVMSSLDRFIIHSESQ
jgi:hypothetical protein